MKSFRITQTIAVGALLVGLSAQSPAQAGVPSFEKQGRYIASDAGLSLAKRHANVAQSAPLGPYDILHYALDLQAAMVTEDFGGRSAITLVLRVPADSIVLNQLALQIDSVTVNEEPAAFSVSDASEEMSIRLGASHPAGDTLRLSIWYQRLPGVHRLTSRLGYFYYPASVTGTANLGYTMAEPSDARCWMPCYDEPWEKATSAINVTVPTGYVVASNGKLLGVTDNGDTSLTWRWREDHQIATYLMCATISKWAVPTSMLVRGTNDSIPVQYYVWQTDSVKTAKFLPTVKQMISGLGNLFGPYPWDKYGMSGVNPFLYGGMEHQTMTTLQQSYETEEFVVVHELTHQWWGDLVTCGTWSDIWLNESFATYGEVLWSEITGGVAGRKSYMFGMQGFANASWQGAVYNPEGQGYYLFDDLVYNKGGWVLHTLRGAIGDSAFFQSLRAWRQAYGQASATTSDFQGVVESVVGKDMSWFFDEWIYGPGWPVYSTAWRWENDTLFLNIYQQQSASWPTYTMPVQIRVTGSGVDSTLVVWDSLRTQSFSLPWTLQPTALTFDPNAWILHQNGTAVGVSNGTTPTPASFALDQNYPNPFNPSTTIRYQVPTAGVVTLKVYDVLGREVRTLVNEHKSIGTYAVNFDGAGLASGMYVYQLRSGSYVSTRRMVMVK